MNTIPDSNPECRIAEAVPLPRSRGGWVRRIWRHYENSPVPLGLKWSVYIAALIVTTMGVLGFFLIQQQESGYRGLADRYSKVIVEQLVRVSGEPLMAGDTLGLQILLQRHVQSPLILGATLYDPAGEVVVAGIGPPEIPAERVGRPDPGSWDWANGEYKAVTYLSPVVFQDVTAGYLMVSVDLRPLEQDLRETLQFLVVSAGLMTLLGVILASVLAHRLSRPIERLARAGAALGSGRPRRRVARRDEIGQVLETFQHLADDATQRNRAEAALSRYVSPQVAQRVLTGETGVVLGGRPVIGSVLFCDIVGFTELSERRSPTEVAELLNDYFRYFALAAESCSGTVDKFIGDCIMIVFGVPDEDPHHALHAMTCGMLIQVLTRRINQLRKKRHQETVILRVGTSSGAMLAGNLGSNDRMQYTVVGDTVNIAARLCSMAEPGGVLLTDAMLASGQPGNLDHYARLGAAQLRGRKEYVEVRSMDVDAVAHQINADHLIEKILSTVGE